MMKFENLAEAWLEDYQKSVKHKTYINAKQAIENHLYPHFAGIAIDEVKSIDACLWIDDGPTHTVSSSIRPG